MLRDDLLDPRLSLAARGLLATMHADPDGDLPDMPGVEAAYAELDAAGYIERPDDQPWEDELLEGGAESGRRLPRPRSVVYYLQRADNAIKIGFTHLTARLKTLTNEHGALALLATELGGWHLEQTRHLSFADLRISPNTEWFQPGEALMAHINDLRSAVAAA